jgi:hypothetical protein
MGLFFTSPALVYVFRAKLREPLVQACWARTLSVLVPIITFYGIGYVQFGYRYALDFMPFLMLLATRGLSPANNKWGSHSDRDQRPDQRVGGNHARHLALAIFPSHSAPAGWRPPWTSQQQRRRGHWPERHHQVPTTAQNCDSLAAVITCEARHSREWKSRENSGDVPWPYICSAQTGGIQKASHVCSVSI